MRVSRGGWSASGRNPLESIRRRSGRTPRRRSSPASRGSRGQNVVKHKANHLSGMVGWSNVKCAKKDHNEPSGVRPNFNGWDRVHYSKPMCLIYNTQKKPPVLHNLNIWVFPTRATGDEVIRNLPTDSSLEERIMRMAAKFGGGTA